MSAGIDTEAARAAASRTSIAIAPEKISGSEHLPVGDGNPSTIPKINWRLPMTTTAKRRAAKPAARKTAKRSPAPRSDLITTSAAKTSSRFHQALARVLLHEGGRVDHPKDPGGRTNKGITQRVYSSWRQKSSLPVRDVFEIDDIEVEAIYRFQYWQPIHGDLLPAGVDYVVMDGAVNSGPKQSGKWLQRALGQLYDSTIDGDIGNVTLAAVTAHPDHDQLVADICERRMIFLQALKTWKTFRKGWTRRVEDVLKAGQAWASGSVPDPAEYRPGGERKANIEDAKSDPPCAPGDIAIGGGGATSAGSPTFIEGIKAELEPYVAKAAWLGNIVIWLVIIGALVAAAGLAYRWWAAREKAKLDDALDRDGKTPDKPAIYLPPPGPPPAPAKQ